MTVFLVFRFEFEVGGAVLSTYELLIIFLAGWTLKLFVSQRDDFSHFNFRNLQIIAFIVFLVFSIPSRIPHLQIRGIFQGIWHFFRNFIEVVPIAFLLLALNIKREKQIKTVVYILLIATCLSCFLGVIQTVTDGRYLTGIGVHGNLKYLGIYPPFPSDANVLAREHIGRISVITHTLRTNMFRAHGALSSHNSFGAFLVLSSILGFALAFWKRNILFSVIAAIHFAGLATTFSRAAWIGWALGLVVLILLRRTYLKDFSHAALILVSAMIVLAIIRPSLIAALYERATTIPSALFNPTVEVTARLDAWELGAKGIIETPSELLFGHGVGGLKEFEILGYSLNSHSDFLDLIYARGLIAFFGLAVFYIFVFKDAYTVFRQNADPFLKAFGGGVFAGLTGILVTGLSQTIHHAKDSSSLVWFVIGLVVYLGWSTRNKVT
jgi:hypothetical protein